MLWRNTNGVYYSLILDYSLAILLVICIFFGFPANVTAFRYFRQKKRDIPTLMYMFITAADSATCVLVVPVMVTLFGNRQPLMFHNHVFRQIWGPCWEIFPYFTVFLVFMLSVLRTYYLIRPLNTIRPTAITAIILAYCSFLVIRFTVGVVGGFGTYTYETKDAYCWNHIHHDHVIFMKWDIIAGVTLLALPIIPILISCLISVIWLGRGRPNGGGSDEAASRRAAYKTRATKTIIILTMVYISFNIPVFINYIRLAIFIFSSNHYDFLDPSKTNRVVESYAWLFTYIMSVGLNALVNPIVYLYRRPSFRQGFFDMWRRGGAREGHVLSSQSGTMSGNVRSGEVLGRVGLRHR